MALAEEDSFTSFPLSHSLPNSPLSPPEDATFSILPRYLLQKVKNTFSGGNNLSDNVSRPSSSRHNSGASSSNNNNHTHASSSDSTRKPGKGISPSRTPAIVDNATPSAGPSRQAYAAAGQRSGSRGHLLHHHSTVQPRIASIRDEAGSSVSRSSPRLSNVGSTRRTLPPLLSRPHQDAVFHVQSAAIPHLGITTTGGITRSHAQSLSTLPESALDYSPPPPYSATPHTPLNTIPGFPINRDGNDDAKSISSVAASNLGVTQIFRRLRGEALSRDYWMADEAAVDCYDCNTTFTTWRRKHHCRVCGRIFCSRCASNVIPGARFGHEGLVRVCNICLAILTHRATNRGPSNDQGLSDRPGLPASSSIANLNISLPLQSSYRAGQSQFAASTLFPRNDLSGYNLSHNMSVDDLAALQRRDRRFSDASFARPDTPDLLDESLSPRPPLVTLGSPLHFVDGKAVASVASSNGSPSLPATTPAPFRKTTADEERPLPSPLPPTPEATSDEAYETSPRALGVAGLGISDPATPLPPSSPMYQSGGPGTGEGSCEGSAGGPLASSTGRPTTPSAASYLPQTITLPYVRSRLNSRAADQIFELADIDDALLANPSYFDSLIKVHENFTNLSTDINFHKIAIDHIRHLLRQCLQHAQVSNSAVWEDVLLKLLIKVAKGPRPRVQEGDSMDVRHYVKIKRVPGGTPKDSEYINGTVFTKSILNKNLPRLLSNPRIMLFDYAFEFEQGETRMSRLDSLRESEKDSLRKLTNSVIDHRPHIVLVGQSVSGLALDYLHKANIIVARNVKPAALQSVARCTQAGIFDTYQFFPDTTRLGRCTVFRAQTLVHKLIPGGRKTLMRFEGCNKDLGATILLRGGDVKTLGKIKRVMRFMTLAAYSVRLELQYLWDAQASLASELDLSKVREPPVRIDGSENFTDEEDDDQREGSNDQAVKRLLKQQETARLINQALKPYTTRILSTSPTVIFPPPHSLERLRLDNMKIRRLRSHHRQEETVTGPVALSKPDGVMTSQTISKSGEPDAALRTSAALTRSLSEVSLLSVKPQSRTRALKISAQLAEESQIEEAEARRNEHLQLWENRLARQQDDLNPVSHQHLSVLRTVICQTTTRICDGPRIVQQQYYRDDSDQTLRQFIENMILSAPYKCQAKGCDKVMLSHYTTYAHGQKRMHVVIEPHLMPSGSEEEILVWSYCRLCELKTMPTTLSQEAGDFSFGKYLELSFYSDHLTSRALPCEHNLHGDHIRFLCWRNVALRVMVDPIDVSDIVVPPLRLRVDAWTQLRIKNEEYRAIQRSTTAYWDSVLHRIRNFNPELLPMDKLEAGQQALTAFEERANQDQRQFEALLDQAYENAPISQPSALNSVRVALQAKVVSWETEFITFEQTFIPSESEKARRATSSHLRRLFSDPNGSVPQSPDLRLSFSPMPSVPPSPSFPPSEQSESGTATVSPEASTRSLLSFTSKSAPLSPTLSDPSEGLPEDSSISIPSLQLTEENLIHLDDLPSGLVQVAPSGPNTDQSPGRRSTTEAGKPNADGDDHSDSDSTVCAEPPRSALSFAPRIEENPSESEDALMLRPFRTKRARTGPSIANLVNRFEEDQVASNPGSSRASPLRPGTSTPPPSRLPVRPGMRRGKSDFSEVRGQRARQTAGPGEPVLSDGDLPAIANASRTSSFLRSPSRLNRPKSPNPARRRPPLTAVPSASAASSRTSSNLTVPGSRAAKLSSLVSVPSRGHEKRVSQDLVTSSDTSGVKGSRGLEFRLPAGAMRLGNSRPSPLLLPKAQKRPPALLPAASQGNRVSTMTKHFNYLSRQAEKERQKQVVLARQRRARPVAVPKTSADIFISSKEALKEDSDDDGSSSGADDEMEGDDDDEKLDKAKIGTSQGNESDTGMLDLAQVDQYLRDHQASLPESHMSAPIETAVSVSSSESSVGTDPATVGTGTESGPSVPVSPLVGGRATLTASRYGNLSESEMSSTGTDRQLSLMKTLSSLWNYRGAEFTPLDLPQSKLEHFDAGNRIVVREDEPSSIIAHGLESQLYKDLMKESHGYSVATSSEIFMPESELGHGVNKSSNWDVLDFHTDGGTDLEEVLRKPTDRHLRLAWDDTTLRYTIRVFFADQFDALRKNSGCQELFIESLARCHKWDAQGGKSGSAFLKTKDDRFIIKEISPAEMTALLDFAPRYFQYLSKAYFDDLPTVLAKILGVFRISFKSQSSGRSKRMDVLVMENIYYNKTITDQFDLKGSLRNRMVETSTGKSCVLLDENLIQMSYDKPFYVREHTKKHLETALFNDSLFLANQKIMDYSLIVGVDRTSSELVVGIVDFLRPYTWDKRLETWVKETAYIGAGTREPTVLNPRIYKTRFREAMSRYFLLVPDRWTSAEAIQTGQPVPSAGPSAPSTKSKSTQVVPGQEEQQEQFAGGLSRVHSPTMSRRLVPMAG